MKPKRMLVWNRPISKVERTVIAILDDGKCIAVFPDEHSDSEIDNSVGTIIWNHCEEIPEKTMRLMTFAEMNKWWNDQIRAGRNPVTRRDSGSIHPYLVVEDTHICPDYTGTDADEWIKLEVEE